MNNGFSINFKISYVFLGLLVILIGGFLIFYYVIPEYGREVKVLDIMAYSTGSVAILTLIYHSLNLESSHYFHKENLRISKNQYSYEVMSKIYEKEMAENFAALKILKIENPLFFEEKNIKGLETHFDENPNLRNNLSVLLNYFEHVSILVYNGHVDEKIIKSGFKTLFTSTYSLLKFYIDERQLTHRTSWIKFEKLSHKWNTE